MIVNEIQRFDITEDLSRLQENCQLINNHLSRRMNCCRDTNLIYQKDICCWGDDDIMISPDSIA